MKKTLAIVLALVMVLCMIPAMSAATTTYGTYKVEGEKYLVNAADAQYKNWIGGYENEKRNTITVEYKWEDIKDDKVNTGRWNEEAVMALIEIGGLNTGITEPVLTVDGEEVKQLDDAIYKTVMGYDTATGVARFPIELTKAGYTDTFHVLLTGVKTVDGVALAFTEKVVVTVKCVNKSEYKADAKIATITNIQSSDKEDLKAYIVGSKIYMDYAAGTTLDSNYAPEYITVTFADENGKPFTQIAYAQKIDTIFDLVDADENIVVGEYKLKDSKASYKLWNAADKLNGTDKFKFVIDTKNADYETKEYKLVVSTNYAPVDPKGIYFAETSKTIKVGEEYVPEVLGLKTNAVVDAKIIVPANGQYNLGILDVNNDETAVVGVNEGVSYIQATYQFRGTGDTYNAFQKIIVTEGTVIPPVVVTTDYVVTCRNLNVRAGAGTSFKKVDMIHRGDVVKVVEISNGWAKLDNGTYVCAKYIAK